jgi:hypothetical protein
MVLIESMRSATVLPFFGDLANIRNDFLRSSTIAKRASANCQILDWFSSRPSDRVGEVAIVRSEPPAMVGWTR